MSSQKGSALIGFFHDREEARNLVGQMIDPAFAQSLDACWADARGRVVRLEPLAEPREEECPLELAEEMIGREESHPGIAALVANTTWGYRMVEIEPLRCLAIECFRSVVERYEQRLVGQGLGEIVKVCIPRRPDPIALRFEQYGANATIGVVGDGDPDLRWSLRPVLKDQGVIGFGFSGGPLPVRVARFQDKLVLCDGLHRALALRELGHLMVPCLVHSARVEAELLVPRDVHFNLRTVLADVSPRVRYFLDGTATEVDLLMLRKVLRMAAESIYVRMG